MRFVLLFPSALLLSNLFFQKKHPKISFLICELEAKARTVEGRGIVTSSCSISAWLLKNCAFEGPLIEMMGPEATDDLIPDLILLNQAIATQDRR